MREVNVKITLTFSDEVENVNEVTRLVANAILDGANHAGIAPENEDAYLETASVNTTQGSYWVIKSSYWVNVRESNVREVALQDDVVLSEWKKLASQHGGVWGEHLKHPKEDWEYEVSEGSTVLGYWDWVANQIEQAEDNDGES
jgi:hypothetical protein